MHNLMKKILFLILIGLTALASCKKDEPVPVEVNHFVNTCWESNNPTAASFTFDFISETECKVIVKVPIIAAVTNYYNYTYNGYKATLIDKNTLKTVWICQINGSNFTVEGRSEIFKRIR